MFSKCQNQRRFPEGIFLVSRKNEWKMAFIKKIERDTRTFLRNHTPS